MLRFLRCYYLHFIHHSELLRASLTKEQKQVFFERKTNKQPIFCSFYSKMIE